MATAVPGGSRKPFAPPFESCPGGASGTHAGVLRLVSLPVLGARARRWRGPRLLRCFAVQSRCSFCWKATELCHSLRVDGLCKPLRERKFLVTCGAVQFCAHERGLTAPCRGLVCLCRRRQALASLIPPRPGNMPLTGWRDPFIFQNGGDGKDWIMLMGSGIKGEGGTMLVYTAKQLSAGKIASVRESQRDIRICQVSCPCLPSLGSSLDNGIQQEL